MNGLKTEIYPQQQQSDSMMIQLEFEPGMIHGPHLSQVITTPYGCCLVPRNISAAIKLHRYHCQGLASASLLNTWTGTRHSSALLSLLRSEHDRAAHWGFMYILVHEIDHIVAATVIGETTDGLAYDIENLPVFISRTILECSCQRPGLCGKGGINQN